MSDEYRGIRTLKVGSGRKVEDGDRVRLNLRLARSLDDLRDDDRVLLTTYSSGASLDTKYSRSTLRPDVYEALEGVRQGGTLVVRIQVDRSISSNAAPEGMLYLEIWVEQVSAATDKNIEVIYSSGRLVYAPGLLSVFAKAVQQRNAVLVFVPQDLEPRFLFLAAAGAEEIGCDPPRRTRERRSAAESAGYALSKSLFDHMSSSRLE